MAAVPVNATGWTELMNGSMISAVYTMYDTAFSGLTGTSGMVVVILFFVYQLLLYMKTQNLTLMWIVGIIFASLYVGSIYAQAFASQFIFLLLVLELAGIFYMLLFAK